MALNSKCKLSLRDILKYFAAYILGIAFSVLFTPAELVLAGKHIWVVYPLFSVFGLFLFYFYLAPEYVFGATLGYWLTYIGILVMLILGAAAQVKSLKRFHPMRHILLGFPIGFGGTLGAYYTIAASI